MVKPFFEVDPIRQYGGNSKTPYVSRHCLMPNKLAKHYDEDRFINSLIIILLRPRGGKITPRAHFVHYSDMSTSSQYSFLDFSCICFLHGTVLVLTSYVFASWRHDVSKWCHFSRRMEISIYTCTRSGIMENWIKHELYHSIK